MQLFSRAPRPTRRCARISLRDCQNAFRFHASHRTCCDRVAVDSDQTPCYCRQGPCFDGRGATVDRATSECSSGISADRSSRPTSHLNVAGSLHELVCLCLLTMDAIVAYPGDDTTVGITSSLDGNRCLTRRGAGVCCNVFHDRHKGLSHRGTAGDV